MLLNEWKINAQDSAYAGLLTINKHVIPNDILALYIL